MKSFSECALLLAQKYPLMQPQDAIKAAYQAAFGGGHLIADEVSARKFLLDEYNRTPQTDAPLYEELAGHARLNLASLDVNGITPELAYRMFSASAKQTDPNADSKLDLYIENLIKLAQTGTFAFSAKELYNCINIYKRTAVSHTDAYRIAYSPSYRVIDARLIPLTALVKKIDSICSEKKRAVVAFEGRAASGKTTSADIIANMYGVDVIHTDDFFLPLQKRTAERYSEPGGNVDYERFKKEVAEQLITGKPFTYRIFDCSKMTLEGEVSVNNNGLVIVEGAYSTHPYFAQGLYDLRVFFDIPQKEQLQRINDRNGADMALRFINEWIPMEEKYYNTFDVQKNCDMSVV